MQQFQEATTWFPSNAECYSFHLSMRLQGHQDGTGRPFPSSAPHPTSVGLATNASAVSPSVMTPTSGIAGFSIVSPGTESFPNGSAFPPHAPLLPQHPQRIQLPRNNSFPPAGNNGRPTPRSTAASSTNNSPPSSVATIPPSSDVEPKPSLVKHLQRIHGLTKKRNYGLQSSRVPFIRDETASASAPYPPAPSHAVDPVNGRPRRNTGVHASKNKKGDDPRRPRRGSVHVTLPESARVSSPDSDSSTSVSAPSPTTTTVAGVVTSPTGPVSAGLQMTGTVPVSSPPLNLAEAAYATPSLWQNEALVQQQQAQQQAQQAAAPTNVAPAFTEQLASQPPALITPAQVQAQVQAQQPQTHSHLRGAAAAPPGSSSSSYSNMPHGNPDSPVAYSTTTAAAATTSTAVRSSSFVSQPSASLNNATPSVIAPVPAAAPTTDDGDKPFIFYPEYEDALMPQAPLFASLPAATQPTPMTQFWSTASAADYSDILNPAATPGSLRGDPTPVYDMPVYDAPVHPQPTHPHHVQPGVVYASEQCTSLQSWAGY
jgi:hypothetical protein